MNTPPETNSSPLRTGRAPKKETIGFQPSIFRGRWLLVSGRVVKGNLAKRCTSRSPQLQEERRSEA